MSATYCLSSNAMVSCSRQCNKYSGKVVSSKKAPVGLWHHGDEAVMTSLSGIEWSLKTYKGQQYLEPSVPSIIRMYRHLV